MLLTLFLINIISCMSFAKGSSEEAVFSDDFEGYELDSYPVSWNTVSSGEEIKVLNNTENGSNYLKLKGGEDESACIKTNNLTILADFTISCRFYIPNGGLDTEECGSISFLGVDVYFSFVDQSNIEVGSCDEEVIISPNIWYSLTITYDADVELKTVYIDNIKRDESEESISNSSSVGRGYSLWLWSGNDDDDDSIREIFFDDVILYNYVKAPIIENTSVIILITITIIFLIAGVVLNSLVKPHSVRKKYKPEPYQKFILAYMLYCLIFSFIIVTLTFNEPAIWNKGAFITNTLIISYIFGFLMLIPVYALGMKGDAVTDQMGTMCGFCCCILFVIVIISVITDGMITNTYGVIMESSSSTGFFYNHIYYGVIAFISTTISTKLIFSVQK